MQVTFDHSVPTAKNIRTFYFMPDKPVAYAPGQFTQIYLPHKNPDERGDKHWFTLSSSPSEDLLSITTKFATPSSSFKEALSKLRPGTKLSLADPMGDFVLPKDTDRPLVFVAGGIGITPFRSMVKWLSDNNERRNIQMIYAVSDPEELAFGELFENYNMNLTPLTKNPPKGWRGRSGSLSGKTIAELCRTTDKKLIYLSGPEPMIEKLEKELLILGVGKSDLVTDFFPGYAKI